MDIENKDKTQKSPAGYTLTTVWILSVLILFIGCADKENHWVKGNLHTHTLWSDGDDFPERVVQWYKDNRYDFLALTDHNQILEGEKWRDFPQDHPALRKYIESMGEGWVEMRPHEEEPDLRRVRLKTWEEFHSMYEETDKFLLMRGNEISSPHAVHLLAFHQQSTVPPAQGIDKEREAMIRKTVENVKAYREETGVNVFPVLAHPNFGWAITAEMMMNVPGLRYFEVYNGHPSVNNAGDEWRAGTERIWDIVLSSRLASGKGEILYGLATDDAHNYHGGATGPGKGWVMVNADELTPEAILNAIDRGDFYASTGVNLKNIQFDGKGLTIEIEPLDGVEYTTEFIGTLKGVDLTSRPSMDSEGNEIENTTRIYSDKMGSVLASSHSLAPSYRFTGNELYVRPRITSSANQTDPLTGNNLEKQKAWVQPHVPMK